MAELLLCSAAETDYAEALCWYADRSLEAVERFDAEFDAAIGAIAATPQRFPLCDDRHRFYLMRAFPFQIIYRQNDDGWVVIAVAHTSRKPQYWSDR